MKLLAQVTRRSNDFLWGRDLGAASALRRRLVHALRMVYAGGRDLAEGQLTLRAMSLVYTTLLSLVPLLALSFSVLKAFGVHNQVRPTLLALLAPMGEKGVEITNQVIGFVDNIKVGVLGALGLGLLIYTVVTLLQKIELSFNFVWRVKSARPLAQRFTQYLSVLMTGPLLTFSAMGVTAAFFGSSTVHALIVIFSMILLYLNWLIVLIGASIACYHQYPALLATPRREFQLSNRVKEKIALLIVTFIGRNYYTNTPAWSLEALASPLGVPVMWVRVVLTAVQHAGHITD